MKHSERQPNREGFIKTIQKEYSGGYNTLRWVSETSAMEARERRALLLEEISRMGSIGAYGTKMDMNRLSPGCRSCVEGRWSCLFINGRCNCRCFYCPTPQDQIGEPTTNTLTFTGSKDYAAYVEAFRFTGASISGGEPFLTFEKSLEYIKAVKQRLGKAIHIWLYTNGSRVTRDKLKALRDAGLDEIRFDIGATGYHLKKAALARGIIPTVTVEIPAIPEELNRIKNLLPHMCDAGISFLNLHQLRLTPHNFKHLSNRGYTFVHGEKATVLESEIAALEIVRFALSMGIELGINYCSFAYKNRFQRAAARLRAAEEIRKPHETITSNGYIRTMFLAGHKEQLSRVIGSIENRADVPGDSWFLESKGTKLYLSPELTDLIDIGGLRIIVSYSEAMLLPAISYFNPFREVRLDTGKSIYVERQKRLPETEVPDNLRTTSNLSGIFSSWDLTQPFEKVAQGLPDYF